MIINNIAKVIVYNLDEKNNWLIDATQLENDKSFCNLILSFNKSFQQNVTIRNQIKYTLKFATNIS